MAYTDWEGAGYGALSGGLGGATTGAGVGMAFGGPPGALIGAGIGATVGLIGGAITGMIDADAQRELEMEMNYQQDMLDKAQKRFEANSIMAGETASEALKQTMTAKNVQNVAKADQVMDEAARTADASGLVGAEKADYLLKAREAANSQSAASDPAVYQQAQAGALQMQQAGVQKAAMTLQSEQAQISQELQRLGATDLPSAQETFGEAMGYGGQALMMGKAIHNQTPGVTSKTPTTGKGALGGGDMTLDRAWNETMADYNTQGHMSDAQKASSMWDASGTPNPAFAGTPDDWKLGPGPGTIGDTPIASYRGGATTTPTTTPTTPTPPPTTTPTTSTAALGGDAQGPVFGPSQFPEGPMLGPAAPPRAQGMEGVDPDLMSVDELMDTSSPLPGHDYTAIPDVNYSDPGPGFDAFGNPLYSDQPIPLGGTGQLGDPVYLESLRRQGFKLRASGGMAGATGPEIAVLGEEGPELVLNAKQTRELATALGGAKAYAGGGVAGAKKKLPGYADGGVSGTGAHPLTADELSFLRSMPGYQEGFSGSARKETEIGGKPADSGARARSLVDYTRHRQEDVRPAWFERPGTDPYAERAGGGYGGTSLTYRGYANQSARSLGQLEREESTGKTKQEAAQQRMSDPTLRGGGKFTAPIPPTPYADVPRPEGEMSPEEMLEYLRAFKDMQGAL